MVLGFTGMPADAEEVMVARDLRMAESTGARFHLMNVSAAGSVDLIRRFRARGVKATAEICPAHFTLTDELLRQFDANHKINPPLRPREHVEACLAGLADGTIDVISSCHAPRASEKKLQELDRAPFGMAHLETTLPLVITELIEPGHLDWPSAIAKLTLNPARALGLDKGTLRPGAAADITIIDPSVSWRFSANESRSRSRNTPFDGRPMKGRAAWVIVDGAVKYQLPTVAY